MSIHVETDAETAITRQRGSARSTRAVTGAPRMSNPSASAPRRDQVVLGGAGLLAQRHAGVGDQLQLSLAERHEIVGLDEQRSESGNRVPPRRARRGTTARRARATPGPNPMITRSTPSARQAAASAAPAAQTPVMRPAARARSITPATTACTLGSPEGEAERAREIAGPHEEEVDALDREQLVEPRDGVARLDLDCEQQLDARAGEVAGDVRPVAGRPRGAESALTRRRVARRGNGSRGLLAARHARHDDALHPAVERREIASGSLPMIRAIVADGGQLGGGRHELQRLDRDARVFGLDAEHVEARRPTHS